jgi:hypothetical protein
VINVAERSSGEPTPPLLPQRTVVIFLAAIIVAAFVGILTWVSGADPWAAMLAGSAAGGGALIPLEKWIG